MGSFETFFKSTLTFNPKTRGTYYTEIALTN